MTMNEYNRAIDQQVADGLRLIGLPEGFSQPSLPIDLPQSPAVSQEMPEKPRQYHTTVGNSSR